MVKVFALSLLTLAQRARLLVVTFAISAFAMAAALAHPHVFVEARSKLVFDDEGNAIAVRHVFRFDDAFTAFAIQGFDQNQDGRYSREELSELAKVNVDSMADFGFFTFGDNTRVELDFAAPTEYWLEVATVPLKDYWVMKPEDFEAIAEDQRMNGAEVAPDVQLLELHFVLPIKNPSDALRPITLDVYDPTYYVDFRFGREQSALGLENEPGACTITRKEPPPLDDATAYALAQIGPDQRDLPPELQSAAASQVNQMIVTCNGAVATEQKPVGAVVEASAPEGAVEQPVASAPASKKLSGGDALAQGAQGEVSARDVPSELSGKSAGFADRIFGSIARMQKDFYQELVSALRSFRSNPNAFWLLVGLSFGYGVFHAAGPGHGKAIITSYVVANNETLRKGIVLSFLSAFAQALTAIVLVGGLAVVFNLTSIVIQDTARWLELGSYLMITALGAWLLWQKGLRPLIGGKPAHDTHDHHHHHEHHHEHHEHGHDHVVGADGTCSTCGHAHAPTPTMLEGKVTLARAASIVLAVGLRPCTGALVVLVFALSQGMIAAGIASTLAMAVGTGITVAVLAGLAVGAKDLAVRLFGEGSPAAAKIHRTIEILGAVIVFLLGLTLLIAALGWG